MLAVAVAASTGMHHSLTNTEHQLQSYMLLYSGRVCITFRDCIQKHKLKQYTRVCVCVCVFASVVLAREVMERPVVRARVIH